MIPWVREKIAERRARWLATRSKRSNNNRQENINLVNENATLPASTAALESASLSDNIDFIRATTHTIHRNQNPATICLRKNARASLCSTTSQSNASSEERLTERRAEIHEQISVRVICPNSRILILEVDDNMRLVDLKNDVLLELADDPSALPLFAADVRQLSPRYRLFRAEFSGAELNETQTLKALNITQDDSLVLTQKRNLLHKNLTLDRDLQGPSQTEIENATRALEVRTQHLPLVDINEIFQQSNLQFDVRKVLISLAQISARIIAAGPYATRLIEMLRQKLISKRDIRKETVQCLVEMGFKQEEAEYALKVNNNVYSETLEWLMTKQAAENKPLPTMALQKSQSLLSPSAIMTNDSVVENIAALLEIVRIYSHRDIPPTPDCISPLIEMGFAEEDVLRALKKTCNNQAAACEWLCGYRSESLVELRDGLAPDSPILKTILEMPQVQMNLSNPKVLLAFLAILENENNMRIWGSDNDTTSVITSILQKYHEEKHVMGLNQFYSDRY